MKWLTQKQVKEAAKKSPKAAHDCVIEHWTQLATCTFDELKKVIKSKSNIINSCYCAFCSKYTKRQLCSACPIRIKTRKDYCEKTFYYDARGYFNVFLYDQTEDNFDLFHKTAEEELKFLKTLRA